MRLAGFGVALTALVTLLVRLAWGSGAAWRAALAFGLLATVIHLGAVASLRPAWKSQVMFKQLALRWAVGMGLRLVGAGILALAVIARPTTFPVLPAAVGFLGVLVPLLFTEIRFLK